MIDPKEKPAFGQVWQWGATPVMLLHRMPGKMGAWNAVTLLEGRRPTMLSWSGLYDDPAERISDWRRLA